MDKPLLGSESDDEGSSSGGGVMGSFKNGLNKLVHSASDHHAHENENKANPWPIAVLMRTTNNFSHENILGEGGSGIVYKGKLNDFMLAVKRMQCRSRFECESQLAVLQKVGNPQHLVALVGYCMDENERIFVYEYMSQGSLSRHLFDSSEAEPLRWDRRLLIALDVARAVDFLHTSGHIHGDLKPSNVLLQNDMRAKIADFGIAPHGKSSGAFGYLAPECTTATGGVTTKIDVYSFGVILMELLTGRRSFDHNQPEDSIHLVPWFQSMFGAKDSFCSMIDHKITIEESLASTIHTVGDLSIHCTAYMPDQRPEMSYAVDLLSSLVE